MKEARLLVGGVDVTDMMVTGRRVPNNDCVICPNCTHQFVAIPVNVQQHQLRQQQNAASGTEAAVCADIVQRQQRGVAKYGVTVADNPLALRDWLQHAYEECLDQAVYLRRAMQAMDARRGEGNGAQMMYALERAAQANEKHANALFDQGDYGAEFPGTDAELIRAAMELLGAGSHSPPLPEPPTLHDTVGKLP